MKPAPSILPQPQKLTQTGGTWSYRPPGGRATRPALGLSAEPVAVLQAQVDLLAGYLREENHVSVQTVSTETSAIHLALRVPPRHDATDRVDESYQLTVTADKITIAGASPAGVAFGIQSLRQLLSGQRARLELPGLIIDDAPALGWRGLHLDVSRHFRDGADIRRFVDLAAYHKFNLFHWHLTDDQGWRLPIHGYPLLTEVAAWRKGTLIGHDDAGAHHTDDVRHGGFYTHEDIRAIVAYAATRGVQILPEVDVPGHVQALVTAYPEMGHSGSAPGVRTRWGVSSNTLNLEPATFVFLDRMVETLASLFPFRYLHFGGDEAMLDEWAASGRIQQRKRELGLDSDRAVQGYFTARLQAMAAARGRRMIGWDEIVEAGLPAPDTAVMYWRDTQATDLTALQAGHPLVLASNSHTYFDHYQNESEGTGEPLAIGGSISLAKVYAWQPLHRYPPELRKGILGAQAQLWTEYIPTRQHLDYMTYPRACALAQVLWSGEDREDYATFFDKLAHHLQRLDRLGVTYRPPEEPTMTRISPNNYKPGTFVPSL